MAEENLRALSLKQPWLYAISHMDKRIENRTWKPPEHMIGRRFFLHASKKVDPAGTQFFRERWGDEFTDNLPYGRGVIVASCVCTGWIDKDHRSAIPSPLWWADQEKWWFPEHYGWVIKDVILVPATMYATGHLSFWRIPEDAADILQRNMTRHEAAAIKEALGD